MSRHKCGSGVLPTILGTCHCAYRLADSDRQVSTL